jgi:polysaccharide export outer membrane protein
MRGIKVSQSENGPAVDIMNNKASLPCTDRPRDGSTPIARAARVLAVWLALVVMTGCSTAPSWVTSEQCANQRDSFPELCAVIPANRIAQDFKAFASAPDAPDATLADPASLHRLDPKSLRPPYRIGPHDELTITVWGSREIWAEITDQSLQPTRTTTVQDDGTIVLPLIMRVQVDGLTLSEALRRVSDAYRKVLGSSFQVDGQISRFRSKPVMLDGAVSKPGTVFLSNDVRTLGEAIASGAAGVADLAELRKGVLIRGDQRYAIDYQSAQAGASDVSNIELQPGDRIYFPSRETGQFYVLGEVNVPGAFIIPPKGISLMQGLALARGPSMNYADMQSIYLVRVNGTEPKIYALTLDDIIASKDQPLLPGDRIFVPPTTLANWERTLRAVVPIIGTPIIIRQGYGVSLP